MCAWSALTAVVFSFCSCTPSRAPQFEAQVYTQFPSHGYINSYHSALMLQFGVFQNHLNPDLLSDRVWMKTSGVLQQPGNNYFVCSIANKISYGF